MVASQALKRNHSPAVARTRRGVAWLHHKYSDSTTRHSFHHASTSRSLPSHASHIALCVCVCVCSGGALGSGTSSGGGVHSAQQDGRSEPHPPLILHFTVGLVIHRLTVGLVIYSGSKQSLLVSRSRHSPLDSRSSHSQSMTPQEDVALFFALAAWPRGCNPFLMNQL